MGFGQSAGVALASPSLKGSNWPCSMQDLFDDEALAIDASIAEAAIDAIPGWDARRAAAGDAAASGGCFAALPADEPAADGNDLAEAVAAGPLNRVVVAQGLCDIARRANRFESVKHRMEFVRSRRDLKVQAKRYAGVEHDYDRLTEAWNEKMGLRSGDRVGPPVRRASANGKRRHLWRPRHLGVKLPLKQKHKHSNQWDFRHMLIIGWSGVGRGRDADAQS